jgi:hypothetical protein
MTGGADFTLADPVTALIVSSSWWHFTARIALRFAALGWRVEAICPAGHPLRFTRAVARVHPYGALRPLRSLAAAIAAARPTLVVACDERVREHLHALHRHTSPGTPLAELIVRSIGDPGGFATVLQRAEVSRLAEEAQVRAPATWLVRSPVDLREALDALGLPVMLKVDGTFGGTGVILAQSSAEAERALRLLSVRPQMWRALKRLLANRDPFHLLPSLTGSAPRVNAQRYVSGRPANSSVACYQGEVLAEIHVEVLRTCEPLGPSSVVRVIEHTEMAATAAALVRELGLSGFCGFDFILEGTDAAHLIEINARCTPLCHLALGPGRDLVGALTARLTGHAAPVSQPMTDNGLIAHFPQAWQQDPTGELLRAAFHDVPWEDPGLVRELVRAPYAQRSLLARLLGRWGRHVGPNFPMARPIVSTSIRSLDKKEGMAR